MEIPKYIAKLINRRACLACQLTEVDCALTEWLDKNDITESLELFDYLGGAEMYVNPWESARRIMEAIENK